MKMMMRTAVLPFAAIIALGACQRPVDVYSADPAPMGPQPVVLTSVGMTVPAGTQLQVSLDESLGTATSEVNDRFTASLLTPVVNADGETVVPAGATVTGIVTALRESMDVATPAVIRLDFESISWDGESVPLAAEVIEANPQRTGDRTDEAIRGAAAGAAAGAVLGAIIGQDVEGAAVGAALGAGAGTAISLGTSNQGAVLEAGSTLVIELMQPVLAP